MQKYQAFFSGYLLLFVGVSLLLTGCVSQEKFEKLSSAHNEVVVERNTLEENNKTLNQQVEQLTGEKAQLNEALEQINQQLAQKQQELTILNEKFAASTQELNEIDAQLVTKNDQLDQASAELLTNRQALDLTQEQLQARTSELRKAQEYVEKTNQVYDGLVEGLTSELAANKIKIREMKDGINVELSQDILFPAGFAELNLLGSDVISKVSNTLKDIPHKIIVAGFTDSVPIRGSLAKKYPSNWELAGARAASVVRVLEANGVDASKMAAISYGATQPIESNDSIDGRAKNRRIEIRLRPNT